MRRIIFAVHGIRSPKQGNWVFVFTDFAKQDPRFKDDIFEPYYYGFVLAPVCVFPPFKYEMVKQLKTALRQIVNDNPNCNLNIVAHSYGTELSFWAIKTSGEDGEPPLMVDKMILVSSVVSRYNEIPYTTTLRAGKIKQLHCYCSYDDKVCNYATFGHSGCFGFSRDRYDSTCYRKPFDDLEIYNHQVQTLGHCDYFKDTTYYKEWLDIIAS
jgi:pimeloyl-ACP methyl ester carboxylesterase